MEHVIEFERMSDICENTQRLFVWPVIHNIQLNRKYICVYGTNMASPNRKDFENKTFVVQLGNVKPNKSNKQTIVNP